MKNFSSKLEEDLVMHEKIKKMDSKEFIEMLNKQYTEGWGYYKTMVKMPQDAFNSLPEIPKIALEALVEVVDDYIKDGERFDAKAFVITANFIYNGYPNETYRKAILEAFDYFSTYDIITDPFKGIQACASMMLEGTASFKIKIPICEQEHTVVIEKDKVYKFIGVYNDLMTRV